MKRLAFAAWMMAFGILACGGSLAATPPDPLESLTQAYALAVQPGEQADQYRDLFGTVLQRVQRSYPGEVEVPKLVAAAVKALETAKPGSAEPAAAFKTAINAALATMDPHSRYLDNRERRDQRSVISGSFGGLGMEVDMAEGLVRVVTPMEDTPAARAGLRSGDLIVRFDEQPVLGMSLADAIARMRGEPGTPIKLIVRRSTEEFAVALVRENIRTRAVQWRLENDVLVLRVAQFTGSVVPMVEKALGEATATRMPRAVVLDMRGNPGGLLNQAIDLADAFLSQGEIVSLRGRVARGNRSWTADPVEHLAGVPMVVLLDGRSASAAELVAAALQENGRAVVMGQRSFGKGSVQSVISLGADKGALRLTTALYHGPSGRTVQRTGVSPDIELLAATSRSGRREADRTTALPGADEPPAPKASVEQARCGGKDEALACAMAFIQAGSIESFVAGVGSAER
jgi:carboxyl-terminal processing protease